MAARLLMTMIVGVFVFATLMPDSVAQEPAKQYFIAIFSRVPRGSMRNLRMNRPVSKNTART
jgi:hypothetical protein